MQQAKVSIIVPVYNVEKYIHECMDSLVNQTLWEIEIILIDNGSLDGSSAIIQNYAKGDSRIRIIKVEVNQGMPRARNLGLSAVTGEYIAFVDSDDLCDYTMFEKMYKQAKRFDADVVSCNVLRFFEDWHKGVDHHPEIWYNRTDCVMPITACPEQFMEQAAWAKLFRRTYIESLPYQFTPGSLCCEDVPACTHAFLSTSKIALVNETLYFYRNRPNSLSNNMHSKYTDDFIWAMQQQESIIEQHKFDDELTRSIITEVRFLLANHILSKMRHSDRPHYFKHMWKAFSIHDKQYLKKFFLSFPCSAALFDAIMKAAPKTSKTL